MSDPAEIQRGLPDPEEREGLPPPAPEPLRSVVRRSYAAAALALALSLIVIGAVVATAPWWVPLLPWGPQSGREAALSRRLDQLDTARREELQQRQAANAAMQKLDQRVAALEARPAPTPPEIPQLRQQLGELQKAAGDQAARIAAVENAAKQPPAALAGFEKRMTAVESAGKDRDASLAELERRTRALDGAIGQRQGSVADAEKRVTALEKAGADRAGTVSALGKQVAALDSTLKERAGAITDLDRRVSSLNAQLHGQTVSASVDAGLGFTLMRISDAIATGRPFAAEYRALTAFVKDRPALREAAAPLADPATTGVPSRAVLENGLRALAAQVTATPPSLPTNGGWLSQAWQGVRGLVRIRREGALPAGPAGAVATAEQALAAGDLQSAIDDIAGLKLTGPAAQSAADWLQSARRRAAAEAALSRVEETLMAQSGGAPQNAAPKANRTPAVNGAGGGPPD